MNYIQLYLLGIKLLIDVINYKIWNKNTANNIHFFLLPKLLGLSLTTCEKEQHKFQLQFGLH